MINLFADLSKNDMIEEIRHPEKKNFWKYVGLWPWAQIKFITNLLLIGQVYIIDKSRNEKKDCKSKRDYEKYHEQPDPPNLIDVG